MKLADWISDDITFCFAEDCKHYECHRHPINIRDKTALHSYAQRDAFEDCIRKEEENEKK